MYLSDIYTTSANLAGIPGISIPAAKSSEGLPIGIQLLANQFEEVKLLQTASSQPFSKGEGLINNF
jgi:aspartyl-tRNA(Asn)/glutamyl-tRNA(Gln) amidotransferase subunit A